MEVILLENISNLGGLGDKVNVKAGFGRNYLIPQGKAVPATEANIAAFEARRAELEAAAAAPWPLRRRAPSDQCAGPDLHCGQRGRGRQAVRLRRYPRYRRGCHRRWM